MLPNPVNSHLFQDSYNYWDPRIPKKKKTLHEFHCCCGGKFQKIINKRSAAIDNMINSK